MAIKNPAADSPQETRVESLRTETLEEAFCAHYRSLCAFFLRRGFSREQSQDLAQETFTRAWENLDQLRSGASLESWLISIAFNTWRNSLRHAKTAKRDGNQVPLEEAKLDSQTADPERNTSAVTVSPLETTLARERDRMVHEAFEDLPPQMRRCMQLHVGKNMKYREVAQRLNISINTVKSQIHRAKILLHSRLAPYFQSAPPTTRSLDHE